MNSQSVKTYLQKNMPDIVCFVYLVLVLWKVGCLFLRAKHRHYLASISPTQDALLLYKLTNYVEFRLLYHKALEFALFKGFAIPSISKLLQSTQQFCPSSVVKHYDDMDILSQEFVLNHVDNRRGSLAIRCLNFIHAQYKIPNADLLYTLCLLVLEPIRFTAKFGYKNWMEGEKQAQYVVWHDIGMCMGIKDIPHIYQGIQSPTHGIFRIEQSDWGCHTGFAIIKGFGAVPPLGQTVGLCPVR